MIQNKNNVLKNTTWIVGAKIFQMLIGFAVTALTARYLGPSNYGYIEYVAAFVGFITSIANLGINDVILKELIDHKDKQGEYIGTSLAIRVISSILSTIILLCLITILNPHDNLILFVTLLQSLSLVFQSFEIFNYWYHSMLRSKISSTISTIAYLITILYRIYLLVGQKNVIWFASINAFESLVTAILLYYSYIHNDGQTLIFNKKLIKPIISKSHHFIYSGLMIAIYSQIDKIMLSSWLNDTFVGYYSATISITSMWGFVLAAIIQSFYSPICEAKKENELVYREKIKQLYSLIIWISIIVSSGISIFSPLIIHILYGEAYLPATNCLRIVGWFTGLAYLGSARAPWMLCENNQKFQKYILGIGCIANVILNTILIPILGIDGAAIATLITQSITSFFGPLCFKKIRINSLYILQSINPKYILNFIKGK